MWRFIGAAALPVVLASALTTTPASAVATGRPRAISATAAVAEVPTYVPGLAGWPNGKGFDVAYRTAPGNVMFRRLVDGAWNRWAPIDLGGRLIGGPTITFAGGNSHVFGRGTDSQLWQRVRVNGTWQPWTKVGGLLMSSAPAAAGRPDGRIDVFVRDTYDRLQTRTYRADSGWGPWTSLGGSLYSAPAVALTGANTLRVVATGAEYTVLTRTLTDTTWSDWSSLGGRTHSGPGISSEPTGHRIRIVIRDAQTNRLQLKTYSGSWTGWQVMGGLHVDGPGSAAIGAATTVVARGRDGAFWTRTITGSAWSGESRAWAIGPSTGVPSALRGKNVTKIPTTAKVAALTFDSAWSAAGVPSIRATLQRQNVPATFFLVGDFARAFPVNANLLAGSGFRIGNHSDNHPDFTKISDTTARAEITNARTAIFYANGADPRPLFRFPYGAYTASDITLANGLGYIPVGWSVDSLGWQGTSGGQTAAKVVNRVLAAARPGMIVLMHVGDNPDDHTTLDADALPQIIQGLRNRGYSFVTLDALLP